MTAAAIGGRLDRQFESFHKANPHVYRKLEGLATGWLITNSRVGIGMLWEVLRWQQGIRTTGKPYRLNNNHRSRYARKLLQDHPEWNGRILTRDLRS